MSGLWVVGSVLELQQEGTRGWGGSWNSPPDSDAPWHCSFSGHMPAPAMTVVLAGCPLFTAPLTYSTSQLSPFFLPPTPLWRLDA